MSILCETAAPVPQGVGRVLALRMEWILRSRWHWRVAPGVKMELASTCPADTTPCRDAAPPTAIWSRSVVALRGLASSPLTPSRLAADNWIKHSPVHDVSEQVAPVSGPQINTSCQISSCIGLGNKVHARCNTLDSIPKPSSLLLVLWKNGLPWNWSLCHKGLAHCSRASSPSPFSDQTEKRTLCFWARLHLVQLAPMTHEQKDLCMPSHTEPLTRKSKIITKSITALETASGYFFLLTVWQTFFSFLFNTFQSKDCSSRNEAGRYGPCPPPPPCPLSLPFVCGKLQSKDKCTREMRTCKNKGNSPRETK